MAVTQGHGNPRWTRDETILALDLYLQCLSSMPGPTDPRVVALSAELLALPVYPAEDRKASFRNPEGVAFKLQNLRHVATGKGLAKVSATDREVWSDFGGNPGLVKTLAASIRSEAKAVQSTPEPPEGNDDEEFPEGRLLTAVHKRRERHPGLRLKLVRKRASSPAGLICDACGDGPKTRDVHLQDAGFEAHHLVPLATASPVGTSTKLNDLALLCATCHRLIHRTIQRSRKWITLPEFRALLSGGGPASPLG